MSDETPTEELLTYRDMIRTSSPPWLQTGLAEKILYSIGIHLDVLGDAVVAAVANRFPGFYNYDSLSLLSRERRIVRGRTEGEATFAERLTRWLTDHKTRGGPYALLYQEFYHYAPLLFDMDLLYSNGRRFTFESAAYGAGVPLEQCVQRDFIDWNPGDPMWARWWLFLYTDIWDATPPDDAELADIRLIPRAWNAAHCFGTVVLFPSGAELWNWPPGHTWNETGTWNTSGTPLYVEVEPT